MRIAARIPKLGRADLEEKVNKAYITSAVQIVETSS